jgi:class 3 adenylate cyclase
MTSKPSGTVTFLFTDIEGSTVLAQRYPDKLSALLTRHREILQSVIEAQNGCIARRTRCANTASPGGLG